MPLFYDNTGNLDAQLLKLKERIVKLHQAVIEGEITPNALLRIAKLSTVQLDKILANEHDKELNQLYDIVSAPFPSKTTILSSEDFIACLQWFDQEHGAYLDLVPLASENLQTIKHFLNHLAIFYNVFIQKVILPPSFDKSINLDIDVASVKNNCQEWQATRASQAFYNPRHRTLLLSDKFITNRLSPDEWLTDIDILDAFQILGLDNFGAHITHFDPRDIGAMLHFERQKHEHDSPAIPYTIPLVLNNSRSLEAQGTHWTRLLVIVNPINNPSQISVRYTDSLSSINQRDIEKTIYAALKYTQNKTNRAIDHPITAYPQCKKPCIQIRGTGEQYDGYSCGYRAIQGLLLDLVDTGFLPNPTTQQQHFLACKTSNELRDFIYKTLINEQAINPEGLDPNLLEERANGRHYIKSEHIDNQLREWLTLHETLNAQCITTSSTPIDSAETQDQTEDNDHDIHNYLLEFTVNFNTPARHNLLQGKFELQPATDDEHLAYNLMSALLYLRYQAYRSGNLLAHAKLKTTSRDLLKNIKHSNNPRLINAIAIAQKKHFSALTEHWTDHELQKGYYLRTLMNEWRATSHGQAELQWKNPRFFNTWWHGNQFEEPDTEQTQTIQSQALHWLSNYKDKWWKRGWVSGDRKTVATALINQLKQLDKTNSTPEKILQLILEAKQTILTDDTRQNRKVVSGLNGRLYRFLNDLETRVCAASTPTEMDNAVQHEFNEIKNVLTAFQQRGVYPNSLTQVLNKINLDALNPDKQNSVASQYQLVSEFFTRVLTNLKPDALEDNADLSALHSYCQQKEAHLTYYFGQCSQLSAINQQRSVQVFRAMSAAASTVIDQWLVNEPKSKTPAFEIKYHDNVIPFINTVNFNDLPLPLIKSTSSFLFFNKKLTLNTAKIHKICTQLIATMAKEITAQRPRNEANLEFTSFSLKPCHAREPHDKKPHFLELTVALRIDGIDTTVTYTIKSQTGELARIKPDLEKLRACQDINVTSNPKIAVS